MRLGVGTLAVREAPAVNGLEFSAAGYTGTEAATTLEARDVAELRDQLTEWLAERAPHVARFGT